MNCYLRLKFYTPIINNCAFVILCSFQIFIYCYVRIALKASDSKFIGISTRSLEGLLIDHCIFQVGLKGTSFHVSKHSFAHDGPYALQSMTHKVTLSFLVSHIDNHSCQNSMTI